MQYVKKQIPVDVDGPIIETRMVTTAHGRVRAEAGDYVITDPVTYDTWPIKPDIFQSTYELAPQKKQFKSKYERKFFVLNFKHIPDLSDETRKKFEEAIQCISDELIEHNYYVCNQDEPYAQKVIDIILNGEDQKQAKKEVVETNFTTDNTPKVKICPKCGSNTTFSGDGIYICVESITCKWRGKL